MEYSDEELLLSPNLFASEVHYCLLNGGVRSRGMRRLWRLAKGNPELEQILEIKVAEFRRVTREERVPTMWNLPVRASEWISDRVKFTPPREVATTLAYVVFAVVTVDAVKSRVPWNLLAYQLFGSNSTAAADSSSEYDLFALPEPKHRFSFSRSNLAARSNFGVTTSELSKSPTALAGSGSTMFTESRDRELDQLIRERIKSVLDSAEMKDLLQKNGSVSGANDTKLNELVAHEVEARLKALHIVSPQPAGSKESPAAMSNQNAQTSVESPATDPTAAIVVSAPVGNGTETKGTP
jgi:hypothetical protein